MNINPLFLEKSEDLEEAIKCKALLEDGYSLEDALRCGTDASLIAGTALDWAHEFALDGERVSDFVQMYFDYQSYADDCLLEGIIWPVHHAGVDYIIWP